MAFAVQLVKDSNTNTCSDGAFAPQAALSYPGRLPRPLSAIPQSLKPHKSSRNCIISLGIPPVFPNHVLLL